MTEEEYNEKINTMDKCVEYWMKKAKKLENENNILKNENKILKEGKINVFAELNDETAQSNEMLMNEVADLQGKLKNLASVAEVRLANWQKYEKENAQLKEANETLATMNNNMWVELEKKRAESQGITNKLHQLIKAKEIIKRLLCVVRNHLYIADVNFNALINDAEIILKEE